MNTQINPIFRRTILPSRLGISQLTEIISDYEAIIVSNLNLIVNRYGRRPDYPWIDTKFSSITGQDFPEDDALCGPNTVYGWIQGRALESLAVHANWLKNHDAARNFSELAKKTDTILSELLQQIYMVWKKNNGHLSFFLTPNGDSFVLNFEKQQQTINFTSSSPYNYTDIFAAKGIYAAAAYLHDNEILNDAKQYCLNVFNSTLNNNLVSDQPQFDVNNDVRQLDNRISYAPFMLQLSTAALLAQNERTAASLNIGLDLIRYVLRHHVNLNDQWPQLEAFDFVEFIDQNNKPYSQDNKILSDPGHAVEFVGLALEFIRIIKELTLIDDAQKKDIKEIEKAMPLILIHNFHKGYCGKVGGICKSYDLITRKPINSDMPWWSLPETIRAALRSWDVAKSDSVKKQCLEIFRECHNAFILHYVQSKQNLIVVQTRNKNSEYVDVIPATPDYDPGYHTGICLIRGIESLSHYSD